MPRSSQLRTVFTLLLVIVAGARQLAAYSVLSHEVVVDVVWTSQIEPLLRQRFPAATAEDLRQAHAYAYGGSIIQDMGYYPFGSHEFSDLTHYVRSGDFIRNLLRSSQDLNEYAFALGAMAHYAADTEGHPAVNRAVADEIPELRDRYGPVVTYSENPKAHIRVEFGFDAAQVAKRRFPPNLYHDLIGFQISKPLLERAFLQTYGLPLQEVIKHEDLAIGSYRRAVSKVIPTFTRAAVATHRADLVREIPDFNRRKFIYRLSRSEYHREFGRVYQRPSFGTRVLVFLFHLVPKVGPFKVVNFQTPTPQTEDLYFRSMNRTIDRYRAELTALRRGESPDLPNLDFDTGHATEAGEYDLSDATYATLLHKLAGKHFQPLTPELRDNLLTFYQDTNAPFSTKRHQQAWQRTLQEIQELKATAPAVQLSAAEGK
jgi:hypothetical protein